MKETYPNRWEKEKLLVTSFPQCFRKACFPGASKGVIVWEWVKVIFNGFSIQLITKVISDIPIRRVLCGSLVKSLTRDPEVLGSNRTGSSVFLRRSVLGQNTSEPQPSTGETQEDANNMNCCHMTEILLKAA